MTRLFASLYLDEDVSALIARLLRSRGLAALTTQELGNQGSSDAEQLAYAAQRQLAILTYNRLDCERLASEYHAAGNPHDGITIAVRRPPHEVVRRLLVLLNQLIADEIDNQILYI